MCAPFSSARGAGGLLASWSAVARRRRLRHSFPSTHTVSALGTSRLGEDLLEARYLLLLLETSPFTPAHDHVMSLQGCPYESFGQLPCNGQGFTPKLRTAICSHLHSIT